MSALVTLNTTTTTEPCDAIQATIRLASTANVLVGFRLFVDRELMAVVGFGVNSLVKVQRGIDGTSATPHGSSSTVYIGRADQFFARTPQGRPDDTVLVTPYIDVLNGTIWLPQGDNFPPGTGGRYWQQVTTTYGQAALGVLTTTLDPTVSS